MDPIWLNFITFLSVYTFAIISPGPNFILVVNSSLAGSRRAGLFTALGVATGSGLFGFAGLVGLIVLVETLPHFAQVARLVGGGYLVWVGLGLLRESLRRPEGSDGTMDDSPERMPLTAWRIGLLTNLTNPKAWAFYIALFTVVITPGFLLWQKALINGSMFLISFGWYALVALMITSSRFRPLFRRNLPFIQFVLGLLLVLLGGKMFIAI